MRILQTVTGLGRQLGGPSFCTTQMVRGLRRLGADARILAVSSLDPDDHITDEEFVSFVDNDEATPLKISRNYGRWLADNAADFDIIHANSLWHWHSHQAAKAARKARKPLVITPHGMLFEQALRKSAWKKRLTLTLFQRSDLRRADMLHATSENEMLAMRRFGLRNPIAVIPNALDIKTAPSPRSEANEVTTFGFVGRIYEYKNLESLLSAWSIASPDARLLIVGKGERAYEGRLHRMALDLGLKNVAFTGFKAEDQLTDLVKSLDYLIYPSHPENFGMAIAEAMAAGVPVIASTGTPWSLLRDEQCGWWVDNDPKSLARAIAEAAATSDERRRLMGSRCQRVIMERFTVDRVAPLMLEAYSWLLERGRRPAHIHID